VSRAFAMRERCLREFGGLGRRVLCGLCVLVATGCDPVRTTVQPILVRVTSWASDEPVPDVRVCVKYDYEHNVAAAERRPEPERPAYKWFCDTSNARGEATVLVRWTMLDRSLDRRRGEVCSGRHMWSN